jgi:glycolate oxidase FAD binding subunit
MTQPTLNPQTAEELADMVRDCASRKAAIAVQGNATKQGIGHRVDATPLSVAGMSGITSYDPEEMVISLQAGTPLAEIINALDGRAQMLGFEPSGFETLWPGSRKATIGGTVASAMSGPRRFALGAARDHLLGFSAVNGRGEAFKGGGSVVKNVTGYDLPKLAAGSFGTLFVMTALTLRVYPKPVETRALCIEGLGVSDALACLRMISRSPLEPSGLSYIPQTATKPSQTLCRFEGEPDGVSERLRAASALVAHTTRTLEANETKVAFSRIADIASFFDEGSTLWRISVPQTAAETLLLALKTDRFIVDGAGGTLWVQSAATDIHTQAASAGGHALLVRQQAAAPEPADIFQPLDEVTHTLVSRLKDAFDPQRVLNPGRMYRNI